MSTTLKSLCIRNFRVYCQLFCQQNHLDIQKNVYQKTVLRQLICMQKVEKIRSGNFLTCDNILIIFVKLERIIICGDMNMAFGMHPLYAIPVSFKSGQQLKSLAPDGQVWLTNKITYNTITIITSLCQWILKQPSKNIIFAH